MSGDWSSSQRGRAPHHEHEIVADLWLSNKSGTLTGVRKLQTSQHRKKNDKRDSVAQLAALTESSPKKLKEKSSWLGMTRGYATMASGDGQWVRVRCTLAEMYDGRTESEWILTIIGDKATLQHSLNVKMLRATDIRFADRSLFFRGDCLSIHARPEAFMAHSPSLQSLLPSAAEQAIHRQTHRRQHTPVPVLDPIYLAFESKDAVNCWSALLRSYAQPEIYGQGGAFRMWRQVDLTVMHGRNFGILGKLSSTDGLSPTRSLSDVERGEGATDASADSLVFCEVFVDGQMSGRTMYQKGQMGTGSEPTSWTWLEGFTLADLPPFGVLTVRVWRIKKSTKSTLIGTVEMALSHYRRGQTMEGWYPVMSCIPGGNSIQVGDIRLKMRVDEEVILPSDAYSSITTLLDNCNCLDLLSELDQKMQLGDVSNHMLALAVGRGTFLKDIVDLAEREIDKTPNANTLFRGNSIFTKTVEQAMTLFGRPFLEASVAPCIQELCSERVELETDPSRNQRGPKDLEQSVRLLPIWCTKFWNNIFKMRDHCPPELRRLFQSIRELVEKRFGDDDDVSNLRWQSVSAFCFLRLIVPAILHPHLWGLHPGLPSPGLQRSLTLIAKALQSLANLSKEKKESHMGGLTTFLEQNTGLMREYIIHISSPFPDRGHPDVSDKYDRLLVMHSLRDRREQTRVLTPLVSEAIPVLPHLLDIPKHLAVLSSAVIRHSRTIPPSVTSRPVPHTQDFLVEDFAAKCFEIEKAVQSVSRLASLPQSANAAPRHSQKIHSRRSQSRTGRPNGSTRPTPVTSAWENWKPNAQNIPHPRDEPARPSTAPPTSSSTTSSAPHTPLPSPPSRPLLGMTSDDSDNPPSLSPHPKVLEKQPGASNMLTTHPFIVTTATSRPICPPRPNKLRRTLSQQLNPREIEGIEDAIAKRRPGFLRSLLTRTPK